MGWGKGIPTEESRSEFGRSATCALRREKVTKEMLKLTSHPGSSRFSEHISENKEWRGDN